MKQRAFGKYPVWITFTKAWKELSAAQTRALDVIVTRMDGHTGESQVSEAYIAARIGRSTDTAQRAMRVLRQLGLIVLVSRGGGPNNTNVYRLADSRTDDLEMEPGYMLDNHGNPVHSDTETIAAPTQKAGAYAPGFQQEEPGARMPGFPPREPGVCCSRSRHSQHESPASVGPNPGACVPGSIQSSEDQKQQKTPNATDPPPSGLSGIAAAEGGGNETNADSATIRALEEFGVGEPTRSKLARTPGITPQLVRRIGEDCRQRGKGVGVLVIELRDAIARKQNDETAEQLVRLGEGRDTARQQKAKQTDEDREILEREDQAVAWVATIEDAVLVDLYERMIEVSPNSVRIGLRPPSDLSIQEKAGFLRSLLAVELWRFAQSEHAAKPVDAANGKHRASDTFRDAEPATRPVLQSQGVRDGAMSSESDEQRSPIKLPAVGGQHRLRLPQLTL